MIRSNNATRLFQKRTIRPLYAWHSAVPYAAFLDTSAVGTTVLYPGQVAVKTTGEQMDYCRAGGATDIPFGLFNNFINGDMDDLGGGTEIGVWVGGRDAVFEVLAGPSASETPLATAVTWTTLNATRGGVRLYSDTAGRLTTTVPSSGAQFIVANLIEAVSNTKIIVQLALGLVSVA
jgi:hypothetical protein